jgi:glycosyltransferase involved in cell wall biosynthesis
LKSYKNANSISRRLKVFLSVNFNRRNYLCATLFPQKLFFQKKIRHLEAAAPKKITAVIITYNEAKNIERCLQNLAEIADEIVVIDSFSTDDTPQICQRYGARFFQRPFLGYADQKNWGNAQATSDFILSVDADEVPSELLKRQLIALKNGTATKQAYRFNRLTNFCGTWVRFAGWYPDRKVRLWQNDAAMWVGAGVHEVLEVRKGAQVGRLRGDLLHYSFESLSDYFGRQAKYIRMSFAAKGERQFSFFSGFIKFLYKFLLLFVLKLGFLHGYHGLIISLNGAAKYLIFYVLAEQRQREACPPQPLSDAVLRQTKLRLSSFRPLKTWQLARFLKQKKITQLYISDCTDALDFATAAFWGGVPKVVFENEARHAAQNEALFYFLRSLSR